MSVEDYLVIKPYVPEYGIQGFPVCIPLKEIRNFREALLLAKDVFLTYGLKPTGEIHESHERLWQNGRITYSPKLRKLTRKQITKMKGFVVGRKASEKVGWKRRYKRRR